MGPPFSRCLRRWRHPSMPLSDSVQQVSESMTCMDLNHLVFRVRELAFTASR